MTTPDPLETKELEMDWLHKALEYKQMILLLMNASADCEQKARRLHSDMAMRIRALMEI